jgi:hypothetical protein
LVAVGSGPHFHWLPNGDDEPNRNWDPNPQFVVVNNNRIQAMRILTVHSIEEHLYIIYLDGDGKGQTILFDGTYWEGLPPELSKMFYGCEDVEVFQIGGRTHAVASQNGDLLFGIQMNSSGGDYALQPWKPDLSPIERHILSFHCVSPIGSTWYYSMSGVGTKNVLVGFLREENGYPNPILTILNFDGQHWVDVSPGDWFPNTIDMGSPLDICVFNGKLVVGFRGPDKKSYFLSCVPTYATTGGLQNWQELYVQNASYTSISISVAKEMLCIAAQREDGGLETCSISGDPASIPWGLQPMAGAIVPASGNLQLASISTSQSLFLFLPRVDGGIEYAAFYEMPK